MKTAAYNSQVTPVDPKMCTCLTHRHTKLKKKGKGVGKSKNSHALEVEQRFMKYEILFKPYRQYFIYTI